MPDSTEPETLVDANGARWYRTDRIVQGKYLYHNTGKVYAPTADEIRKLYKGQTFRW